MEPRRSKIRIFSFIALSSLLLVSCEGERNDVIPDVTVDFYISGSDPEFFDLFGSPGSSAFVSSAHTHLGLGTGGYDSNGIIIYNTGMDGFEFYAFDRTCPHCFVTAGLSIRVNTDMIEAICPECNTVYLMSSSGMPYTGPGQYYLKNYRTDYNGYNLRVWNRK